MRDSSSWVDEVSRHTEEVDIAVYIVDIADYIVDIVSLLDLRATSS